MPWGCVWRHKWQIQWSNSDETVMEQWWNSDAFDLGSFMLFDAFDLSFFTLSSRFLNGIWSCFILLQCLGSLFGDTRPFDKNSDGTVMQQWSNSNATVMEQWCLWFENFNVICVVLRCHWSYLILLQCLALCLVTQDHLKKKQWRNSDRTVMRQWWNSDAFDLGSFLSFSSFWDVIDRILSFCNSLGVWLCICWWHKTIWQKLRLNSDETVMEQWCLWFRLFHVISKLLICYWSYFIILQCLGGVLSYTRPFDKNSDQTVMRHWCNNDGTVMPLIWALLCHFQAFVMSLIIFYPLSMPCECGFWSGSKTLPFDKTSDQTVMRQWCNSDRTVMPLIWAL
jgi:hypothetical protein